MCVVQGLQYYVCKLYLRLCAYSFVVVDHVNGSVRTLVDETPLYENDNFYCLRGAPIIETWYCLHMCITLDCSSFVFSLWCHGFQGVQAFLQQCKGSDEIFLLPNQQLLVPPGGQLVHSLNLHTADVTGLAMTADGKFVVTCKLKQQC